MNKPWSQDYNPRIAGESIIDWLRHEVALIDRLDAQGKGTRCISLTPGEARRILAAIPDAAAIEEHNP